MLMSRSARVRPDAEELELLNPKIGGYRSDAELRLFVENELALIVNSKFDQISEQKLKDDLANKVIRHLQIELDLNLERNFDNDPDISILAHRVAVLSFRFDRFLRSLKNGDDEEYRKLRAEKRKAENLEINVQRLTSLTEVDDIPANLVEHMLQVGMEKHLLVVRKYLLGSGQAYGVTVTFKNLTVTRKIPHIQLKEGNKKGKLSELDRFLRPSGPQTVWSATTQVACGCCFAASNQCTSGPRTKKVELLKNLSGVIPSGRLTILLGAPHSGKTQLLHALSRQTKSQGPVTVSGEVHYNGHLYSKIYAPNFCTVVEQTDIHIPTLTVRETLQFAYLCRGFVPHVQDDPERVKRAKKAADSRVDIVMALLGLTRVANTVIGNEQVKGISGGEMRRVTLGEMLVVGSKILLLDEISTGLDSAATFDITKSLQALCHVLNINCLVSLLQPPPETFDIFDDLILMSSGNIVYHGAVNKARGYFEEIGKVPPVGMDFADFLIETSLENVQLLLETYQKSGDHVEEMDTLNKDPIALNQVNQANTNDRLNMSEEILVKSSKYSKSSFSLFLIVAKRQFTILARNKPFIIARLVQNIVMGLLLGAMFFQIPFQQYYLIAMILMQLCSMSAFSMMALIGDTINGRNTFYKQSRENFFPASSYVFADYIVSLPFSLLDAFVLGTITYFMAGLSTTSGGAPYFIFLVLFITYGVCMATAIRFFSYASPSQTTAFSLAVFFNIISLIFSGAVATPSVIPPWWIWLYWISPMAWAYRSMLQNEFYSQKYELQCASGCPNNLQGQCVQYCGTTTVCPAPFPNVTCGVYFLTARQVNTQPYFLWLGAGILWIYTLLFILGSVLILKYVRHDKKSSSSFEEDIKAEQIEVNAETDPEDPNHTPAVRTPIDPFAAENEFKPQALVWRDLVYTIDLVSKEVDDDTEGGGRYALRKKHRVDHVDLLKHVTGFAKPYEMTALMGSSGAGKTTLLDCLCYRKTVGTISARISLGEQIVEPNVFKKDVGYVEQFGIHGETTTVKESLEFSALLRLDKSYTKEKRAEIVQHTLDILELHPIANSLVGKMDAGGLSFEENKRLTIAVELVSNPKVLFADEPTSGLTSKEARITMRALAKVAASGRPVICTIHQPSAYVFSLFHRLLLLKRGGEVVFFGKIGNNAENLVKYFEAVPGVSPLPEGLNPATWMLDVIGAGVGRAADKSALDFAEVYRYSDLARENETELLEILNSPGSQSSTDLMGAHEETVETTHTATNENNTMQLESEKMFRRSFSVQLQALLRRNFIDYWRNPSYSLLRWVILLICAIITGTTFLQQQMNDAAGVQSRVSVINLLLLLSANYNSATIVPFVFSKRALFYRERASGMYASFLYALSFQFTEEPFILVEVILVVVTFYFLVGLALYAGAFFYYLFLMYFFVLFASYMGAMFAALFGVQGAASLVSTLVTQLLVLFSGIAVPGNILPAWLLGFYYFTPVRWAMEGLVCSQFELYTNVICNPSGTAFTWSNGTAPNSQCATLNGTAAAVFLNDVNTNACCNIISSRPISARAYVLTGWTYPDGFVTPPWLGGINGYNPAWIGYDYLYVIIAMIVVRILGVVFTTVINHQKR